MTTEALYRLNARGSAVTYDDALERAIHRASSAVVYALTDDEIAFIAEKYARDPDVEIPIETVRTRVITALAWNTELRYRCEQDDAMVQLSRHSLSGVEQERTPRGEAG